MGTIASIDHIASSGNIPPTTDVELTGRRRVKTRSNSPRGPHLFWRRRKSGVPRAYGDFRGLPDGGREPLAAPGTSTATTDPVLAQELFARRLRELTAEGSGTGRSLADRGITIGAAVGRYLDHRRRQGRVTPEWIVATENMLGRAVAFFGPTKALASIRPDDVAAWLDELRAPTKRRNCRYREETIRKHMNALAGLFRRAQRADWVPQGFNPVSLLESDERPVREPSRTPWLEVPEAAALLEAARTYRTGANEPEMHLAYPLIATFLLTGGRADEVLGLDLSDISFDRKLVFFRPNQWRSGKKGKTTGATRAVPLWPQLEEALHAYLQGPHLDLRLKFDPGLTLLYPSPHTGRRIRDIRGIIDRVARRAGLSEGIYRSRAFRISYATARLQTTDGGAPIAQKTVEVELGHASGAMLQKVYGRLGKVRQRSEVVEFRTAIEAAHVVHEKVVDPERLIPASARAGW